ncbi:hypothetical protein QYE76_064998 [Lolium multiflorum]|uniref:Uncharacterized protein n=1 Tax=Lolium multiflorum TaxID=4521 RepID=A0AAD8W8G3_LOLMU|nr:hypothetical protein QYE76_064998 [Lolium multiflorum]
MSPQIPQLSVRPRKNAHDVKPMTATNLNTFEIISFSTGFDHTHPAYSSKRNAKGARFTSDKACFRHHPRSWNHVAKALNLRSEEKKDNGVMKMQARKEEEWCCSVGNGDL